VQQDARRPWRWPPIVVQGFPTELNEPMIERWDDLRFLLALAREGTLTAAATALGVSQPTVGRRISVLEKKVGTPLIERRPEGYRLSDAGQAVVAQAEHIEAAVLAADRATASNSRKLRGTVKLTSAEWLCGAVFAPALAGFGQRHPDITVELVAEARWINLPRGESDLAIRGARFEHPGLLQRRVALSEVGVYATSDYLKARGLPDLSAGSPGHRFVTLTEDATRGDTAWLKAHASSAQVSARANGRLLLATLAAGGGGLALLPRFVGDATPGLTLLELSPVPPPRELYLGMRPDSRAIPRVRAVAEFVSTALEAVSAKLAPGHLRPVR
jgi:DNA-binding transcriptional LysR family regulator